MWFIHWNWYIIFHPNRLHLGQSAVSSWNCESQCCVNILFLSPVPHVSWKGTEVEVLGWSVYRPSFNRIYNVTPHTVLGSDLIFTLIDVKCYLYSFPSVPVGFSIFFIYLSATWVSSSGTYSCSLFTFVLHGCSFIGFWETLCVFWKWILCQLYLF